MEKEPQGQAAQGWDTLFEGMQQVIQRFHAKGDIEARIFICKIPCAERGFSHGIPKPEIKEEQRCSCAHSTLYALKLYQYQE